MTAAEKANFVTEDKFLAGWLVAQGCRILSVEAISLEANRFTFKPVPQDVIRSYWSQDTKSELCRVAAQGQSAGAIGRMIRSMHSIHLLIRQAQNGLDREYVAELFAPASHKAIPVTEFRLPNMVTRPGMRPLGRPEIYKGPKPRGRRQHPAHHRGMRLSRS